MKPRISLSTIIIYTAVLGPAAALCSTAPVSEYAYGLWSGSHSPSPAEVLVRLSWAWPLLIAITTGAIWLAEKFAAKRGAGGAVDAYVVNSSADN